MEYRTLTGTGVTVSRACLGTMTFGDQVDEATGIRMVGIALDAGVNLIDTADVYTGGRSETIVGKALLAKRDGVVLASKVARPSGAYPLRDVGLHRWHVVRGVEDSLRRLQTDRLDILYLHRPDRSTPIEETLSAVDHLVRQGKVMYLGVSNFAAWRVCEAIWQARTHGWPAPVVAEYPYNLVTRSIDEEAVDMLTSMRVGLTVYNPLAAGLLTGKHQRGDVPTEGTRFATNADYYRRFWNETNFQAVERLGAIAAEAGKSLIELALQWLASQPHVDSVIIGASKCEHLTQNLQALDGRLDEDTLRSCDEVWRAIRGEHFAYNR